MSLQELHEDNDVLCGDANQLDALDIFGKWSGSASKSMSMITYTSGLVATKN